MADAGADGDAMVSMILLYCELVPKTGTAILFALSTMLVVNRNSVKYVIHTKHHTPQGYKGMSNRCLWTCPN